MELYFWLLKYWSDSTARRVPRDNILVCVNSFHWDFFLPEKMNFLDAIFFWRAQTKKSIPLHLVGGRRRNLQNQSKWNWNDQPQHYCLTENWYSDNLSSVKPTNTQLGISLQLCSEREFWTNQSQLLVCSLGVFFKFKEFTLVFWCLTVREDGQNTARGETQGEESKVNKNIRKIHFLIWKEIWYDSIWYSS